MVSFFEKLKKGMGVEITEEEVEEKNEEKTTKESKLPVEQVKKVIKLKKPKKLELKSEPIEKPAEKEVEKIEKIEKPEKIEPEKVEKIEKPEVKEKPLPTETKEEKEKWFEGPVGQLAVDVFQTDEELIIQSAIAGIKSENLDISIENDTVIIKGVRERPGEEKERNYFYQECYWGPFSRKIILPCEVDSSRAEAIMKEGVFTIRMPKIEREKKRKITVKV